MTCAQVVFAGTPEFAVPCLDALYDADVEIAAVYCQPDRPSGRGRTTHACAVKRRALELDLQVVQPATFREPGAVDHFESFSPDLMIVVAYGLLLPASVLGTPRLGCVNVHASLLPRWRGAAPIQRAIEAGDSTTGITLMQMDEGLDTGPMLARAEIPISDHDTGGSLHDRLSGLGADLLCDSLPDILAGRTTPVAQRDAEATYASKIERGEALIDWSEDAASIERRIRAFNPWPVCFTPFGDGQLRLWRASLPEGTASASPGTIVSCEDTGIDVACGEGLLRIHELQRSGGRRLSAADFLNGTRLQPGQALGDTRHATA